jgi:hypothetical protein
MKGYVRGLSRSAQSASGSGGKKTIPLSGTISVADGAPGFGTKVIGDFPAGNIFFAAAVLYLQLTTADADVIAAFDGDVAIGTAPTADSDFGDAGEANIIASTALGAATAKVSPMVRAVNITPLMLDNTDGSLELNLNLLIDDASISGAANFTYEGALYIDYSVMGDD